MADWQRINGPLAATRSGSGRRVVFVHGFTQTGESWRPVAEAIARGGNEVVLVDRPGHGRSGSVSADLPGTAELLADTCGRATYVGYSLGGRVCLHLAVARPDLVERLAVLGATPGLRDADERAARVAGDEALAERIIAIGVDAFLDEWTALPLFGALRPTADDLAARRSNSAAGLAGSLRRCGTGTQQPLWDRLGSLGMPVLAMAGSRDAKFLTLASEIAAGVQRGRFRSIPDADHAAHLQQPAAVLAELSALLATGPGDDWS